ncbi:MAG: hypothetical protein DHS20C15_17730 [Planctomycetota bacterium]|nr:MAG: hypothetical protein DHS20C15_17730 [Planctomycetota bacterium]
MLRRESRVVLGSLALALSLLPACASERAAAHTSIAEAGPRVSADDFLANVAWLADDARQGRQTGSPQADETAEFVRAAFQDAGLKPLPGHGWFQDFEALGDRKLADGNRFVIAGDEQELGVDWMPLPSAASGGSNAPIAFAGYGVSDPDGRYDDYADLDVEGHLVVVLRHGPGASLDDGRLKERYSGGEGRRQVSFAAKINAAYKRGAAGLLVVNDPATHPPGSEDDSVARFHSGGLGSVVSSLPAARLTAQAGAALLTSLGHDLASLQNSIDGAGRPHSFLSEEAPAELTVATERERVPARNVVGWLRGSDPSLAAEHVVVGAHMDHLGLGHRSGSLEGPAGAGKIHNGADDNASGTSGLIEIARALGSGAERPARSVIFMAFGAEEWGLLGSHHYVDNPWLPIENCVAMLNMDMIGRSGGKLSVEGMGTSPGFRALIQGLNSGLGSDALELSLGDGIPPNTDHAPFYDADISVISFFTGLHDDYHRPSDDVERIDSEGGAAIASLVARATLEIASAPERPEFTRYVAPAKPQSTAAAHEGQEVVGYGVSFGSQPDMTYQGEDGVRISGVRSGSPAEKAGLQGGDVIVALDGQEVRSLEDYSILLFSHRPGDEITVTVKRGEEQLDLTAVLAARGAN